MDISQKLRTKWSILTSQLHQNHWQTLLVTVGLVILAEFWRQMSGSESPLAFLLLGVAVAGMTYREGLRVGLAHTVVVTAYFAYNAILVFQSQLWIGYLLENILGIIAIFVIAFCVGKQAQFNKQRKQELRQIQNELEERVQERINILSVANEFLQQEIGDRLCAQQALQESEARMRLIIDSLTLLIAYIDAQQCYRFSNQQYEARFGHSPSKLEGKKLREILGKANYEQIKSDIELALSGKEVTQQHTLTLKDKSPCNLEINFIPHFSEDKKVLGCFAIAKELIKS